MIDRVLNFAVKLHDRPEQAHEFLKDWFNGELHKWPDFTEWLLRDPPAFDNGLSMLIRDNNKMRKAGTNLAEAALYTIREYDGVHRLSIAVSDWAKVIAGEGDRDIRC